LLTGRPPFEGESSHAILEQVKHEPVPDPRKYDRSIERDLAGLCLRCLEKEPEHRYRSAGELADTLRRFLDGEPVGRVSAFERALRWRRRNPLLAAVATMLLAFLLIMTPSALSLMRGEEAHKRAEIVADNQNAAQLFAYAVLGHLRALSDAVARAAAEEPLARGLERGDAPALQQFVDAKLAEYEDAAQGLKLDDNSPFDMWCLLDNEGTLVADSRLSVVARRQKNVATDYEWRDYFIGARELASRGSIATYVSPAFKSENDDRHKFAISTPVYSRDRSHRPLGVLVAAVAAQANLGSLILKDTHAVAVLVAPHGRERHDPQPKPSFLILRHPAYSRYGEAVPTDGPELRRLASVQPATLLGRERWGLPRRDLAANRDYRDPVAERYSAYVGHWIAAFAPVGNTGFVVVVQTLETDALKPIRTFGVGLAKAGGLSLSPGLLLLAAGVARSRRGRVWRASQAKQHD
ncbi:MAG TPA: hypothetical protein VLJ38_11135, partial [Polyangiaceae bacterium]|nr:hypothetical protein [Polyangiaceae bacterium]